jgi:hypothetical protein
MINIGSHLAIGGALGLGIGALVGLHDDEVVKDMLIGLGIGLSIGTVAGVARSIAEYAYLPYVRNRAAEAAAALPGSTFPVVAYNKYNKVCGFNTGLLGAQLIAEAEGIPRSLWDTHLVSFQELSFKTAPCPAAFNGRVIAVTHGRMEDALIEVGAVEYNNANYFLDLFTARDFSGNAFTRNNPITHLDLCVCFGASSGFMKDLKTELDARKWTTTGWASQTAVGPKGFGLRSGVIRAGGNWASEALLYLFPFWEAGAAMPDWRAGVAAGGWVRF